MNLKEYLESNGGSVGSETGFTAEFAVKAAVPVGTIYNIASGRVKDRSKMRLGIAVAIVKASNGLITYEDLLEGPKVDLIVRRKGGEK